MLFITSSKKLIFLAKWVQRFSSLAAILSISLFFLFLSQDLLRETIGLPKFLDFLPIPNIDKNRLLNIEDWYNDSSKDYSLLKGIFNITLIFIFSLQHSLMSREVIKKFFRNINKNYIFFERSIFNLSAAICLGICLYLYQPNDKTFIDISNSFTNSIFLFLLTLNLLLEMYAFYDMIEADDILGFGLIKIFEKNNGTFFPIEFKQKSPSLLSELMRHPIYFCSLSHLWLGATRISCGRMIFSVFFTVFIFVGTYFEEQEIIRKYPSYLKYIKKVPNKFLPNLSILLKKTKNI